MKAMDDYRDGNRTERCKSSFAPPRTILFMSMLYLSLFIRFGGKSYLTPVLAEISWYMVELVEHVDEILSLMRKRQIWYPKHYDQTDLILDLNFYNTLYDQYNNLREKSLVDGAPPMHEALTSFEMDGDILKYYLLINHIYAYKLRMMRMKKKKKKGIEKHTSASLKTW
uniref:Uncharacterized protein n=1 Tax=Solanum tuberosum TaxID=4113 RepID=M1DCL2_SOLTU